MRRYGMAASLFICALFALWAGTKVTGFVSGQQAYAFYMPPHHSPRVMSCRVTVWGLERHYQIRDQWLKCSAYYAATLERDPSIPLQWDSEHVTLRSKAPR
jgi:hypothetical protein